MKRTKAYKNVVMKVREAIRMTSDSNNNSIMILTQHLSIFTRYSLLFSRQNFSNFADTEQRSPFNYGFFLFFFICHGHLYFVLLRSFPDTLLMLTHQTLRTQTSGADHIFRQKYQNHRSQRRCCLKKQDSYR